MNRTALTGGHGSPPEGDPADPEVLPPEGDSWEHLLPGRNPYDEVVRRTKGRFSYLDAKAREQSNGELIANDRRKHELDEARGKVVPRAEMDRAVAMVRDAWWKSAQQITSDVLASLPGLPLEARELINRACGEAVARAALRVKSDLAK